jgi:hypothetical protein
MMLVALSDEDGNLARAAMWNGSSFTNQTPLPTDDDGLQKDREHADGAFESLSGQALAAYYQDSYSPGYRTLTGASWSSNQNAPWVGGETRWCRLVADPASDRIIMATLDHKRDINMTVWNGSAWGTPYQVDKKSSSTSARRMDLAFEPEGTQALLVYDDETSTLRYRTWDGFGWSVEFPGPAGASQPLYNPQAVTGLSAGQVFVTFCSDATSIRTVVWDGASFGSTTVLGNSSAPKEHEAFMVAIAGVGALPKVVSWQEVQP